MNSVAAHNTESDAACLACTDENALPHTPACLFDHFLAYTGFADESDDVKQKLRKAYYDGMEGAQPTGAAEAEELWDSLRNCIAFSAKDWSLEKRDAWVFGIVLGWGGALPVIAKKHGWSEREMVRLRRLHDAFQRLKSAEPQQAQGEPRTYGNVLADALHEMLPELTADQAEIVEDAERVIRRECATPADQSGSACPPADAVSSVQDEGMVSVRTDDLQWLAGCMYGLVNDACNDEAKTRWARVQSALSSTKA